MNYDPNQQPLPEQPAQPPYEPLPQPQYQYHQPAPQPIPEQPSQQPWGQYQQQRQQQPAQQPVAPVQINVAQPNLANQYQQWQVQAQFTKSYTTPAIITLVLYIFLWIPGLIANIIYLLEANKTKKITGVSPDGYGCLVTLLCAVAAPVLFGGIIFMIILLVGALAAAGAAVGH